MNIPEAIEILKALKRRDYGFTTPDCHTALQLAIEALKRCRTLAQESPLWKLHPLPGETED